MKIKDLSKSKIRLSKDRKKILSELAYAPNYLKLFFFYSTHRICGEILQLFFNNNIYKEESHQRHAKLMTPRL